VLGLCCDCPLICGYVHSILSHSRKELRVHEIPVTIYLFRSREKIDYGDKLLFKFLSITSSWDVDYSVEACSTKSVLPCRGMTRSGFMLYHSTGTHTQSTMTAHGSARASTIYLTEYTKKKKHRRP